MIQRMVGCASGRAASKHCRNPTELFTIHSEPFIHMGIVMKNLAFSFVIGAMSLALVPPVAQAQLGNSFTPGEARNARDNGDIVPLRDIFRKLKQQHGGYQVDANLFNRGGRQVYVIDWMTGKGERVRFTVDAKSGRVLSSS